MSRPRPVYPGDCTMAQKQCYGQQFRLRPDADVVQTILYTLAYTANKYDIELHDFVVMSNHDHIVSTDPEGARPLFIGLFHSLVARAINSRFGDVDALWSSRRYSSPRLLEGDDVFAKCVYTLLNPVQAHLVRYAWDWQGPSSYALEYDKPVTIKKPNFFFSKNMPNEVSLVLRRPKKLEPQVEARELRTKIRAAVKVQQGEIAAASRRSGRTFMAWVGSFDNRETPRRTRETFARAFVRTSLHVASGRASKRCKTSSAFGLRTKPRCEPSSKARQRSIHTAATARSCWVGLVLARHSWR